VDEGKGRPVTVDVIKAWEGSEGRAPFILYLRTR